MQVYIGVDAVMLCRGLAAGLGFIQHQVALSATKREQEVGLGIVSRKTHHTHVCVRVCVQQTRVVHFSFCFGHPHPETD